MTWRGLGWSSIMLLSRRLATTRDSSASLPASTTDARLYRPPNNLSGVISPSDRVKWRIRPRGIDEARNHHQRYASGLCAQCAIERVFDRHASLRFDAECRRNSKVGGAGGPPMATVAHALFRQRTALRQLAAARLSLPPQHSSTRVDASTVGPPARGPPLAIEPLSHPTMSD
jgi:hypothetical protein